MDARRVCNECTQNCEILHGQKLEPSPVDKSFIKILYGKHDFSKILYLPPKVSLVTIPDLKDGEYHLEDYYGKRWLVTLGTSCGALAFEKGWDQFYADHELKEGYILHFNYIRSHFVVKIYDTTGTEKILFKQNSNTGNRSPTNGTEEVENQKTPNVSTSIAPASEDNRMQSQPLIMIEPQSSEDGDDRSRRPLTTYLKPREEKGKGSETMTKDKDSGAQNEDYKFKLPPTTSLVTSTKSERESQVMTKDENPVPRKLSSGEPPAEVADEAPMGKKVSAVDIDDRDDLDTPLKKRVLAHRKC